MKKEALRRRIALLSCAGMMALAGCGGKDDISKEAETAAGEQAAEMPGDDGSVLEGEGVMDRDDAESPPQEPEGNDEESEENDKNEEIEEKTQALYEAQIRHYYGGILSQITAAWQLPDGEMDTWALEEGDGEMCENSFAVTDIDGDGREELIVRYTNASMAGMVEIIYGYDPILGELRRELTEFPALTYYDNGIIKAEISHNQGPGEFWPFALYRYDSSSNSYEKVGFVETWDKAMRETWYEGQPFPDELDTDGDGTLYFICKEGEEYALEYEKFKYNQADYDKWFGEMTEGASEISIDYQPMEYESFAEFTPAYLKIKAEEAGRERTDTADDLGLLILSEDHFLEEAQSLLAEKYDVELTQPDPDFEEWTVGMVEGQEVFSFEALNAGTMGYQGEKVGDVTIFGMYPGISVDGAWKKLSAYGFYASPYGEIENCLITGEGFGNISIWFEAEDNKVTQISVMPFCAFAG